MKNKSVILMIRAKKSGDTIGLKEDIAMRLAGLVDIERIDVAEDAAEVVRCKDCKYMKNDGACNKCFKGIYSISGYKAVNLYDYCSYGERKEK